MARLLLMVVPVITGSTDTVKGFLIPFTSPYSKISTQDLSKMHDISENLPFLKCSSIVFAIQFCSVHHRVVKFVNKFNTFNEWWMIPNLISDLIIPDSWWMKTKCITRFWHWGHVFCIHWDHRATAFRSTTLLTYFTCEKFLSSYGFTAEGSQV